MGVSFVNNEELRQIILIRHGEPDLEIKKSYSFDEAKEYTREYDQVGIKEVKDNDLIQADVDQIYSSHLPRAISTAEKLFPEKPIIRDPVFAEFESQLVKLPGRFNIRTWLRVGRFFWFLGVEKEGHESRKNAFKRVRKALIKLESIAEKDNKVVLVTHGMFIHFLKEEMRKKGWNEKVDGGQDYLAVHLMTK